MIPYLPIETRREAAQRSLELRQQRALIKHELGTWSFAIGARKMQMLWKHPAAQGMKVFDLLCALPGIGKARASALLDQAGIPVKNTVRACGPKQTERLFSLLS